MTRVRLSASFAVVGGLTLALGLGGCGRKSGLDLPPSASAPVAPVAVVSPPPRPGAYAGTAIVPGTNPNTSAKDGFDANGNPVAPPGPRADFPLDFLLR